LKKIDKKYFIKEKEPLCPECGCKHLYKKKDFNQALGCIIILIGALFVPFTYGLSLVVLFLIDLYLYNKVEDSIECYKCKSEFKNVSIPDNFTQFDHHTAEIYENDK
jgi:hypothetical protein